MIKILVSKSKNFNKQLEYYLSIRRQTSASKLSVVKKILKDVKKNRIFLIQFNRFMWEDVEKGVFRKSKRIQSVLKFENIIYSIVTRFSFNRFYC